MTEQIKLYTSPTGDPIASKTIQIDASVSQVWKALTNPEWMKKWMSETPIDIITDWQMGGQFIIRGELHGLPFENAGTVLQFDREKVLQYSHLSSLSRLPDEPESYSLIEFRLTPLEHQTSLTLTLQQFPTEAIYKHLVFYWNVTLEILKRTIEEQIE